MKKLEKTQKTKERILEAALLEFGNKSYDAASVNSICEKGQIPKGLIYHNFKGKDELYLLCVKTVYDALYKALMAEPLKIQDAKEGLQNILIVRQRFFEENPYFANIFFNAVLQPPKHLVQELSQLRKGVDEYLNQCFLSILDCLSLREDITRKTALEYFWAVSEMFNGYFQKKADQNGDYRDLIQDHEGKLSVILDIMLYGIVKQSHERPGESK